MTIKSGGSKTVARVVGTALALALLAAGPAAAQQPEQANQQQTSSNTASFLKDVFIAAIDVASHAAQSTSDTVHHNIGNVIGTAAKARGFVRDTVSGVLGNARKLSGMVGDVMPFTEHNHFEGGTPPEKKAGEH